MVQIIHSQTSLLPEREREQVLKNWYKFSDDAIKRVTKFEAKTFKKKRLNVLLREATYKTHLKDWRLSQKVNRKKKDFFVLTTSYIRKVCPKSHKAVDNLHEKSLLDSICRVNELVGNR